MGKVYWQHMPAVEVQCWQQGKPATLEQSLATSARILRDAKAPGIVGLNLVSTETCTAAVALARQLKCWLSPWPADPLRFWGHSAPDLALSRAEMQAGADLVIYLGFPDGVDAVQPRHRERHLSRGLGMDRPQLHLPWDSDEGLKRTLELRLLLERGDSASPEVTAVADAISKAQCIQVYVLASVAQHFPGMVTHWQALAAKQRGQRRMGVALLGSTGKARTVTETLTWLTGYPGPVNFSTGEPEYLPHIGEVEALLARKACDLLLWVGMPPLTASMATNLVLASAPINDAAASWQVPGLHPKLDAHVIRGDGVMLRLAGSSPGLADPMATVLQRLLEELSR